MTQKIDVACHRLFSAYLACTAIVALLVLAACEASDPSATNDPAFHRYRMFYDNGPHGRD
ncbi:MAG: hypothetical protein ABWY00_10495 [Dongiaceae bacterium]